MKKRRKSRFYYDYEKISEITGISIPALKKRRQKGEFNMADFNSIAHFVVGIQLIRRLKEDQ